MRGLLTSCELLLPIPANRSAAMASSGKGQWQPLFFFFFFPSAILCFSDPLFLCHPPPCASDLTGPCPRLESLLFRSLISYPPHNLSTSMHLLNPFSFSPVWVRPIFVPQTFGFVTFSYYRVSQLSRKMRRASARVVTPPLSACVSVSALLHVGVSFPLASFSWWLQTRSVGCLFVDDASCF